MKELVKWAEKSPTGDIAELDWQPHHKAWQSVSVGSDECPGATKCPSGGQCFAEHAKYRAAAADVVVVNTHLYGIHVASGGAILPEHEVVIFDEAHQLEDTLTATVGVTISASRATTLATAMNKVVEDDKLLTELFDAAAHLRTLFAPHIETRLSLPLPVDIAERLNTLRITVNSCLDALRKIESTLETVRQKVLRAQTLATRFADDLDAVLRVSATSVPFVSGTTERPELVIAPLDVGPILAEFVWPLHTAIMTSATIPLSMPERIGLSTDKVHVLDVGSPFNYEEQGRLYCATHLPDPNAQRDDAVHDELATLITAAGGRTLALFTSRRALTSAVEEMRKRLPFASWLKMKTKSQVCCATFSSTKPVASLQQRAFSKVSTFLVAHSRSSSSTAFPFLIAITRCWRHVETCMARKVLPRSTYHGPLPHSLKQQAVSFAHAPTKVWWLCSTRAWQARATGGQSLTHSRR